MQHVLISTQLLDSNLQNIAVFRKFCKCSRFYNYIIENLAEMWLIFMKVSANFPFHIARLYTYLFIHANLIFPETSLLESAAGDSLRGAPIPRGSHLFLLEREEKKMWLTLNVFQISPKIVSISLRISRRSAR